MFRTCPSLCNFRTTQVKAGGQVTISGLDRHIAAFRKYKPFNIILDYDLLMSSIALTILAAVCALFLATDY